MKNIKHDEHKVPLNPILLKSFVESERERERERARAIEREDKKKMVGEDDDSTLEIGTDERNKRREFERSLDVYRIERVSRGK